MVYSPLDIFTAVVSTRTGNIHLKYVAGATHTSNRYFRSYSNQVEHAATPEEGSCINQEKWQVLPVAITTQ